jgi:cell shape-determining protein MreC
VLAVNQAYNFVVLNLGGRQGVEPNTEMLVLRGGSFIGKIRISSVEPATAIGDIITSSLARGVQVQPGDTVIYAGPNSRPYLFETHQNRIAFLCGDRARFLRDQRVTATDCRS